MSELELRNALALTMGRAPSKRKARALGVARDKRIAELMRGGGARRLRAAQIARWSIDQVYQLDDDELADEWADAVDRVVRTSVAFLDRVRPNGTWGDVANEAQFLLVSTKAIKLVAERFLFLVDYVTENDTRVCQKCHDAERAGPYDPGGAPEPPLHLNCRCVLTPIALKRNISRNFGSISRKTSNKSKN